MACGRGFNSPRLHHLPVRIRLYAVKAPSQSTTWRFFFVRMRTHEVAYCHLVCGSDFAAECRSELMCSRRFDGGRRGAGARRARGRLTAQPTGRPRTGLAIDRRIVARSTSFPGERKRWHSEGNELLFTWNEFHTECKARVFDRNQFHSACNEFHSECNSLPSERNSFQFDSN